MDFKTSVFQTVPKILFGCGAIKKLAEEAKDLGATRVAVVTDPGLVEAKVHLPVMEVLKSAGLNPAIFKDVEHWLGWRKRHGYFQSGSCNAQQ
jgi:alcohol dehydrogenase class IV